MRHLPGDGADTYVSLSWSGDAALREPARDVPLSIVRAEYGAEGSWADVTPTVARSVHEGRLALRVGNDLFGDPAKDRVKALRLTYEREGRRTTVQTPENEELVVGNDLRYDLVPGAGASTLSFVCAFAPKPLPRRLPSPDETIDASAKAWPAFWREGGAIDLSESRDPRWKELERRIVLSQYLMKVNESGSQPPQESGLVNNGWFGRFHLEMVWWHLTHWALWNRWADIERTRRFYLRLLPQARALAKVQGYEGARWPKCIGPDARSGRSTTTPSSSGNSRTRSSSPNWTTAPQPPRRSENGAPSSR